MKKKNFPVVVVLLSIVVLTAVSCGYTGGKDSVDASVATVKWLEGSVTADGTVLELDDEVVSGAVIITGEDSLVELEFGDHRILRASENSRLVLDAVSREMKLDAGAIAVVQSRARRFGSDTSWQLRTPTAVAAVRGTVYYAKVESPDETYFCLCNGKIHLEDADEGTFLDLAASHHDAVLFTRTEDGVVYGDAPMKYHTDADIEALADRVHVPVDWTNIAE